MPQQGDLGKLRVPPKDLLVDLLGDPQGPRPAHGADAKPHGQILVPQISEPLCGGASEEREAHGPQPEESAQVDGQPQPVEVIPNVSGSVINGIGAVDPDLPKGRRRSKLGSGRVPRPDIGPARVHQQYLPYYLRLQPNHHRPKDYGKRNQRLQLDLMLEL